jgi:hypothetical protein
MVKRLCYLAKYEWHLVALPPSLPSLATREREKREAGLDEPPSAICHDPLSAIRHPPSAIRDPRSAIHFRKSSQRMTAKDELVRIVEHDGG